jgi:hypothetical protein
VLREEISFLEDNQSPEKASVVFAENLELLRNYRRAPEKDGAGKDGWVEKCAAEAAEKAISQWERYPQAQAFMAANPEFPALWCAVVAEIWSAVLLTQLSNREALLRHQPQLFPDQAFTRARPARGEL